MPWKKLRPQGTAPSSSRRGGPPSATITSLSTSGEFPRSGRRSARWSSTRRTACSFREVRESPPRGKGGSSRPWPARPWRPAWGARGRWSGRCWRFGRRWKGSSPPGRGRKSDAPGDGAAAGREARPPGKEANAMGRDKSDRPGELARRASRVLSIEAEAIMGLRERLDENFSRAIDILLRAPGKVILTGGGKSGLIGKENGPTVG